MKKVWVFGLVFMMLGMGTLAQAALVDRGSDVLGNHLFYDSSQDITWYDYTHSVDSQLNQWQWSQDLVVDMADGRSFSDWRLPWTNGTIIGYTSEGEMGHLFYIDYWGNDSFPMGNLVQNGTYWTMNLNPENQNEGFYYSFVNGQQGTITNTISLYGLAVYDGDVGSSVPIPAAVWLFGSGLLGLIGIKRRFSGQA